MERNKRYLKENSTFQIQDKFYYNLVPVQMCIYALRHNLENSMRVYITLKFYYPSGKFRSNSENRKRLLPILNVTDRTIRNQIKKLESIGWIRKNKKTDYYILISYDQLRIKKNWTTRSAIEFYSNDLKFFKEKLAAVPYAYLYYDYMRKKSRLRSALNSRNAHHFGSNSSYEKKNFAPISVLSLEKIFVISRSKASRLKILASKRNFLEIRKDLTRLNLNRKSFQMIQKFYPEISRQFIVYGDKVYRQGPDQIYVHMHIRKRKKLGTYNSR